MEKAVIFNLNFSISSCKVQRLAFFFCGYFSADFQVSQISYLKSTLPVCIDDQGCVNFKSSIIRSIGRRCVWKKKCIDAYEALEISFDVVALFQKFYCSTYLSILHQIKFSQENLYHCSRNFFSHCCLNLTENISLTWK